MPAVNGVGKPCAGEPHARFDGRELETAHRSHQGHGDEGHQGKPCGHQRLRDLPSMRVTAPALDPPTSPQSPQQPILTATKQGQQLDDAPGGPGRAGRIGQHSAPAVALRRSASSLGNSAPESDRARRVQSGWMVGVTLARGLAAHAEQQPGPDDPHLPERFLLDQLRPLEGSQDPEQREQLEVTITRLDDLFAPVLHQDALDAQDTDAAWVDGILDGTAPYVAITSRGQFTSLVPRDVAINAVLRSLIRDHVQSTPGSTARSSDAAATQ